MTELRVDHGCLDVAAADMSAAVRAIDERLGRLDGDLRSMHGDWTGEAQQAYAIAQATFALIYAHKKFGIIPDSVMDLGKADDSVVVRAALIQNQKAFELYAAVQGEDWSKVTSRP